MTDVERGLQALLEALYRIEGPPPVSDFRIDRKTLERFSPLGPHRREVLLVQEHEDETFIALFIEQDVLQRVTNLSEDGLSRGSDLDALCVAVEGVSHFVYLTFCGAGLERPVSQIELELQAEIDKFLLLRFVLGHHTETLVADLYDQFDFVEALGAEEVDRYRVANRNARRYARWLDRRWASGDGGAALADARALYRKPFAAKLEHIERAA